MRFTMEKGSVFALFLFFLMPFIDIWLSSETFKKASFIYFPASCTGAVRCLVAETGPGKKGEGEPALPAEPVDPPGQLLCPPEHGGHGSPHLQIRHGGNHNHFWVVKSSNF